MLSGLWRWAVPIAGVCRPFRPLWRSPEGRPERHGRGRYTNSPGVKPISVRNPGSDSLISTLVVDIASPQRGDLWVVSIKLMFYVPSERFVQVARIVHNRKIFRAFAQCVPTARPSIQLVFYPQYVPLEHVSNTYG